MASAPDPRRGFYVPQFQIKLKGQKLDREAIADVIDVTYTDDEANLDFFEFSLNDWDPIQRRPKYSSPWDKAGQPFKLGKGDAPNFEPGADVELYIYYMGGGDPVPIMKGEVVSITPNFPAAGAPTCRVRAVNYLYRLQAEHVSDTLTGSKMDIASQIAKKAGISEVTMPPGADMGAQTTDTLNNVIAYEEILKRARDSGLVMWLEDGEKPILHFEAPAGDQPIATLSWGVDLVSFAPQLSTRNLVETVIVRGVDPTKPAGQQAVEGKAKWADMGIDPAALGPLGLSGLLTAIEGLTETIDVAEVRTKEEAEARAKARLREIIGGVVVATGASVGMPEIRTGRVIQIDKLGERFSGKYRISQSTHSLGAGGYAVSFQAKKLLLP